MAEHDTASSSELQDAKQKIINEIELQKPKNFESIKESKVNVSFVQAAIKTLVEQMNSGLVNELNIQLGGSDTKLTKLTEEVGNVDSGLIQDVKALGLRIKVLEEDKTVSEDVWS